MGRAPRIASPARLHHVTNRGNDRRTIFVDDADFQGFLTQAHVTGRHRRWSLLSYCLMPNHVHLLIDATVDDLSAGMRDLSGAYVRRFNRRHGTSGHLFGGRFHSVPVTSDRQLTAVVRYIARNPVEAGLCNCPEDWQWSSYAALIGDRPPDAALALDAALRLVGSNADNARRRIRALATVPSAGGDAQFG